MTCLNLSTVPRLCSTPDQCYGEFGECGRGGPIPGGGVAGGTARRPPAVGYPHSVAHGVCDVEGAGDQGPDHCRDIRQNTRQKGRLPQCREFPPNCDN